MQGAGVFLARRSIPDAASSVELSIYDSQDCYPSHPSIGVLATTQSALARAASYAAISVPNLCRVLFVDMSSTSSPCIASVAHPGASVAFASVGKPFHVP